MSIFKKRTGFILASLVLTFIISGISFADYYKYTDENGQTSYTDDLSRVPEDQRENSESYKTITTVTKNGTTSIEYNDEVLYYDKETGYKIIQRDGVLMSIVKDAQGGEIYTELEEYPPNFPPPGTHIDKE